VFFSFFLLMIIFYYLVLIFVHAQSAQPKKNTKGPGEGNTR